MLAEKLNGEEQILWARGGGGDTAEVPAVGVATCQAGLHRLRVTPSPPHCVREACGRGLHREAPSLCSPDSWAHRWLSCENFCPLGHMVQPWCRPAGPCLTFITPCRPDPCGRLRRDHQRKGQGGSRQQPLPTSLPRFPPSHLVSLSESQPTSAREPWGRGGCVKESGFRLRSSRSPSPWPRNTKKLRSDKKG